MEVKRGTSTPPPEWLKLKDFWHQVLKRMWSDCNKHTMRVLLATIWSLWQTGSVSARVARVSYNTATPLLGIYSQEMHTYVYQRTRTRICNIHKLETLQMCNSGMATWVVVGSHDVNTTQQCYLQHMGESHQHNVDLKTQNKTYGRIPFI